MSAFPIPVIPMPHVLTLLVLMSAHVMMDSLEMDSLVKVYIQQAYLIVYNPASMIMHCIMVYYFRYQ